MALTKQTARKGDFGGKLTRAILCTGGKVIRGDSDNKEQTPPVQRDFFLIIFFFRLLKT